MTKRRRRHKPPEPAPHVESHGNGNGGRMTNAERQAFIDKAVEDAVAPLYAQLAERVADYFQCEPDTRVAFMERVLPFRPEKIQEVPAVAHEDGTGRVQTVDGNSPARYREVLVEFEKLTGVPVVLNTSFNLNGEPMVNSPEDAIRTFYSCGLDILYLGNVRITKSPSDA